MEFIRSPDDSFAGYLQEDSDLEFSACSGEGSSDEEEGCYHVGTESHGVLVAVQPEASEECSDDEFERDMESELMGLLETVSSPSVLVAAAAHHRGRGPVKSKIGAAPHFKQAGRETGELSSRDSNKRQRDLTQQASREKKERTTPSQGSREEGGEDRLDQAAAYYDKVYFDSSGSEEEGDTDAKKKSKQSRQCRRLTNEELFYDPHMDEEDEQWVKRQRMAYHNVKISQQLKDERQQRMAESHPLRETGAGEGTSGGSNKRGGRKEGKREWDSSKALKKSDALLSCPACMTTVCIDCQQHSEYGNQFRAMFVMNCRINRDEVLKHVPKVTKREKRKRKWKGKKKGGGGGGGGGGGSEDAGDNEEGEAEDYHPVHCAECNTEIAVYDKDEVFHFFNVLASASS